MTCPSCAADLAPEQTVRTLAICPSCLRTVAIDGDTCRLAVDTDTTVLSEAELKKLKAWRAAAREARVA